MSEGSTQPRLPAKGSKEKRQCAVAIGLCIVAGIAANTIKGLTWFKLIMGLLIAVSVVIALIGVAPLL